MSGLTTSSNVTNIAKQLITQCNLIQPSRLPELEQLLMYLQKRKLEKKGVLLQSSTPHANYFSVTDAPASGNIGLSNSQPLPSDVSVTIFLFSVFEENLFRRKIKQI